MNSIGMCHHNNINGYCPSCVYEKGAKSMSGFGADSCPEGYYRLKVFGIDTGQCLPSGSTALEAAQEGVVSSAATGVAQSSATQAAATQAAGNALGTKIVSFYRNNPSMAIGLTVVVGGLLVYGAMAFLRGK